MDWIILFIISWALFIFLVDWKKLRLNIWSGILALVIQTSVDSHAISHKLYKINDPIVCLWGSTLFFTFGPVFVIGTLLAQFHPVRKWVRIANIIIVSGLLSLQELLLIIRQDIVYLNWHSIDSAVVNIGAITLLSWFTIVVLNKGVSYKS